MLSFECKFNCNGLTIDMWFVQVLADTIDLPCRIAKGCKYCKRDDASSCLVRFGLDRYTFITINIFILFSFFFLILSWSIVRFTIQIYQILNAFHHTKKELAWLHVLLLFWTVFPLIEEALPEATVNLELGQPFCVSTTKWLVCIHSALPCTHGQ